MLSLITRIYSGVIVALAMLSGLMIFLFIIFIVYDVLTRTFGFKPPYYTTSIIEYGILYITLLSSPWVLRIKGHIYVDTAITYANKKTKVFFNNFSYIICIIVCSVLFYYSLELTIINYQRGDLDLRSFDMPRWLVYAPMPVCFLLLGIEFLRYLLGRDSMYGQDPDSSGGL